MPVRKLSLLIICFFLASVSAVADDENDPIARVRPWRNDVGRAAWSPKGDLIAFDKTGDDGYSDLFLIRPDGTLEDCLTCHRLEFRKRHVGDPAWHPSGRYLVFQVSKPFERGGKPFPFLGVPGRNLGNDLWAINLEQRKYWQLTNTTERGGRVLSAAFSREGDQLAWSERVASSGTWGQWVIRTGRFEHSSKVLRVKGVKTLKPGHRGSFYEIYGFSADDRSLLIGGTLAEEQPIHGMDLYKVSLRDEQPVALTESPTQWDRFGSFAPNGEWLIWSTNRDIHERGPGIARGETSAAKPFDLWWAKGDGSGARRLTRFNDPLSDTYAGLVMVGPTTWSPAGDRLLTLITPVDDPTQGSLFLIELDQPYGR